MENKPFTTLEYLLSAFAGVVARAVVEPVETSRVCGGGWGSPRGRLALSEAEVFPQKVLTKFNRKKELTGRV